MDCIHVLIFVCISVVSSYHFYNPLSHDLLSSTSLNNIPRGYKLLPPSRTNRTKARLTRGGISEACGDGGFKCNAPYDKSLTQQFECTSDSQCPSHYKCCPQKCFLHKICLRSNSEIVDDNDNCDRQKPGQCEKWPYNCRRPYNYALTYMFKCHRDNQCPRNFKCCQQSCFAHKICSRIITNRKTTPIKIINATTRRTTTTTTTEAPTIIEETENEEETEAEEDAAEYSPTATEDDYNAIDQDESETAETLPETTEIVEEAEEEEEEEEDTTTEKESIPEIELETVETNTSEQTTTTEEGYDEKNQSESITVRSSIGRSNVGVKDTPKLTTPDSNAIDPNYAEYYYNYDNTTGTDEDYEEYDEGDDDV